MYLIIFNPGNLLLRLEMLCTQRETSLEMKMQMQHFCHSQSQMDGKIERTIHFYILARWGAQIKFHLLPLFFFYIPILESHSSVSLPLSSFCPFFSLFESCPHLPLVFLFSPGLSRMKEAFWDTSLHLFLTSSHPAVIPAAKLHLRCF